MYIIHKLYFSDPNIFFKACEPSKIKTLGFKKVDCLWVGLLPTPAAPTFQEYVFILHGSIQEPLAQVVGVGVEATVSDAAAGSRVGIDQFLSPSP